MLKEGAGAKLHLARERKGLSRAALVKAVVERGFTVSEATIFNLEKSRHPGSNPQPRTIIVLAETLDLDPDDLYDFQAAAS